MVMDKYYHQVDPIQELWVKINNLHLSYLHMEDSPQKLEHRNKLEDCINDYLCMVPHSQKFQLRCTAEVLYRSASGNKDFSGYRAALGFDAVGRYAANLITKPWRREYRQIKMYSGFYKHEIESNLESAEKMFEAMGYRQVGREILVLEDPICREQVTSVSLDSLMAYVECRILKFVWEEVSNVFNIGWLDVLKNRESHLCSPKQLVSSLIYMFHQRQYQEKIPNFQNDLMCNPKMHPHPHHISHMHQAPVYPMMPTTHIPAPCMYQMNGCCGGGAPYLVPTYPQYPPPHIPMNYIPVKPQFVNPHYKYNSVPTAQLIELDHTYDTPDGPQRRYDNVAEIDKKMRQLYVSDRKPPSEPKISDRDDGSGTFESWDYVYRNLESQGYSKDLGERGDILSQTLDLEDRRNSLIKTAKKVDTRERKKSEHNLYDNLQPTKTLPKTEKKIQPPSQPPVVASTSTPIPGPSNVSKQDIKNKKSDIKTGTAQQPNEWHCSACTYLNKTGKDICEMCSKSRNGKVEELQAGGTECNKCTYVNNKSEKICVMCDASLDKNPTYI